jgi:hypothetical protein
VTKKTTQSCDILRLTTTGDTVTGYEEPYFHWKNGKSTLKVLPILIAYFPGKYVGVYFVYTTSLFYFIYA